MSGGADFATATGPLPATAFDPLAFMKLIHKLGHTAALGLRYRDHRDDWVEIVLPANPRLVGDTGVLASGPIVGLLDMATSMAVWIARGRFVPHATLDLRLECLRPASAGAEILGRGMVTELNGDIAFTRGIAHQGDPDDPIAHVAATFMVTAG